MQNLQNLLGIDFDGHGGLGCAINNGGNLAPDANAARRVLVELALAGAGVTTS